MKLSVLCVFSLNISDDQFLNAIFFFFCIQGSNSILEDTFFVCLSRLLRTNSNRMRISYNIGVSKGGVPGSVVHHLSRDIQDAVLIFWNELCWQWTPFKMLTSTELFWSCFLFVIKQTILLEKSSFCQKNYLSHLSMLI